MRLTPEELSARKTRNLAIAGALVAFMILVFVTTMLNLQRNRDRPKALMNPAVAEAQR